MKIDIEFIIGILMIFGIFLSISLLHLSVIMGWLK